MEEWSLIVIRGFKVHYEVSTLGQVRNVQTGRILKQSINSQGYPFVSLPVDYVGRYQVQTHILVANAFLIKPEGRRIEVHHKDENKLNPVLTNLEYIKHRHHMQEHASNRRVNKLSQRVEQQIEFDKIVRSIS